MNLPLPKFTEANLRTAPSGIQLALRAGVAAALSLAIAQVLRLDHPIYAAIAAVIVTDLAPSRSRHLGLHRIGGTVLGALCGGLLSSLLPANAWAVGLGITITMLTTHLLEGRDGVRVAGYISGLIMANFSVAPWTFALHRFTETLVGVVIAGAISHVPKLMRWETKESGNQT